MRKNLKRVEVKPAAFSRFCDDFEKTGILPFTKLGLELTNLSPGDVTKFFYTHGSDILDLKIEGNPEIETSRVFGYRNQYLNLQYLRTIFREAKNLKVLSLDMRIIPELSGPIYNVEELRNLSLTRVRVESLEFEGAIPRMSKSFLDGMVAMLPNIKVRGWLQRFLPITVCS